MADLVEFVIDGILQREQMQQRAKQQRLQQDGGHVKRAQSFHINQAKLDADGSQLPISNKEKDAALWKVSRQFEAIFVQQMMTEMRKSVSKSDFMPSGYAEDMHASMMDEAIAQASAKRSSFGIADSIYRQLEAAGNRNTASQQRATVQEISNTADGLETSSALAMEVTKHAH